MPTGSPGYEESDILLGTGDQLDREQFSISLLTYLAETLEEVAGLSEAEGFIAIVARKVGREICEGYQAITGNERLSREEVANVLVDLKKRINGGFSIESVTEDEIILVNTRCPFHKRELNKPSLCMLTTNVFGQIASQNLGYARVEVQEALARGDDRCRVVIHLKPTKAQTEAGVEFYQLV